MRPLLSIVIPTHERAHYALKTACALMDSLPSSVEIIVSDTSKKDLLSEPLKDSVQEERLKLIRPERELSVVEHFNLAMSYATGDYLCFIGDDDFVLPELLQISIWAKKYKIEAVKMTFPALYYWPDFKHKTKDDLYSGSLHLENFSSSVRRVNAKLAMHNAAVNLGTGVGDMPRAYAGLISRILVERI